MGYFKPLKCGILKLNEFLWSTETVHCTVYSRIDVHCPHTYGTNVPLSLSLFSSIPCRFGQLRKVFLVVIGKIVFQSNLISSMRQKTD